MQIDQLIKAGNSISKERSTNIVCDADNELTEALNTFLFKSNGLIAFESALIVRPGTAGLSIRDIKTWNDTGLWKSIYEDAAIDSALFFAEDAFGNQYGIFEDRICFLDVETGELEGFADSFEEWADNMLEAYELHTGWNLIHEWQVQNGPIKAEKRLCPKRPFVLGGEYELDNLYAGSTLESVRYRADIARQIKNLPNGAAIQIKLV